MWALRLRRRIGRGLLVLSGVLFSRVFRLIFDSFTAHFGVNPVIWSMVSFETPVEVIGDIAKRSALDETHGPDWPLPRNLRHGRELTSGENTDPPYPPCPLPPYQPKHLRSFRFSGIQTAGEHQPGVIYRRFVTCLLLFLT